MEYEGEQIGGQRDEARGVEHGAARDRGDYIICMKEYRVAAQRARALIGLRHKRTVRQLEALLY